MTRRLGLASIGALVVGWAAAVPTPASASVVVQTTTSVACNEAGQVELTASFENVGTERVTAAFRPTVPLGDAVPYLSDTYLDPGGSDVLPLFTGQGRVDAGTITVEVWAGTPPVGPPASTTEVPYAALDCGGTDFTATWNPSEGPPGTAVDVSGAGCPPSSSVDVQFAIIIGDLEAGDGLLNFDSAANGTFATTYTVPAELDAGRGPTYPVMAYCVSTGVILRRAGGFTYQRDGGGGGGGGQLPPIPVSRIAGENRYATAAAISAATFPPGVAAVFIATGEAFPDALAGTPAAIRTGSPLLLTRPHELPAATVAELQRLAPVNVFVLGGESAVGAEVVAALGDLSTGAVERLSGADRYGTAAQIAHLTPGEVPVAYVATGTAFADALAGGPAAGTLGGPLLLADPGSVPVIALDRLSPERIVVLGGTGAVSDGTLSQLALLTDVERVGGADRFATSAAVSAGAFAPPVARVYLATGENFPDALAGGVAAGLTPGPLLLVRRDCIPADVATEILRLAPTSIVLLGGEGAVGSGVAALRICAA